MRLLFFFFLALTANAQEEQPRHAIASYRDFSGGLIDSVAPLYLQPNQSPHIENFLVDETPGALVTRKGFSKCGDIPSGNTALGIWRFTSSAGTSSIVVSDGANFYSTQDCVNYTTFQTGWNSANVPDCEMVYSELWCTNGTNTPFKWNGSSTVVLGGGGVANVPTGEFIEFEKGIVWMAKTPSSLSSVFFSDITDPTTGDIVSPSSSTVWPASNEIRVAQNDGDQIYGMRKYQGSIHVCKSNSIHVLRGEDRYSFGFFRTVDNAGCHNNTMVEADGLLYFMGKNGIYKYDGNSAVRISDGIRNLTDSIRLPLVNSNLKTWTSQTDYTAGTLVNLQAANPEGDLRVTKDEFIDDFTDGDFTSSKTWSSKLYTFGDAVVTNSMVRLRNADLVLASNRSTGTWSITSGLATGIGAGCFDRTGSYSIRGPIFLFMGISSSPPQGYGLRYNCGNGAYELVKVIDGSRKLSALSGEYLFGEVNILGNCGNNSWVYDGAYSTRAFTITRDLNGTIKFYSPTSGGPCVNVTDTSYSSMTHIGLLGQESYVLFDDVRVPFQASTGLITSDIINAGTNFGSWGQIKISEDRNGGETNYFVRVGTTNDSAAQQSVQNATFTAISDGAIISTRTNAAYAQWKASFTATNGIDSPFLHSLTINWNQTGARSILPAAGFINNRYWLSVATGSLTSKQTTIVRSKSGDTFVLFISTAGFNGFARVNDRDYAISASTDEIYTLESGANDNNAPIRSLWESRDETWGYPMNSKRIMEYNLDYLGTFVETSIAVRQSTNSGNTFSSTTTATSPVLTGVGRKTKRIREPSLNTLQMRHRLESYELDHGITIFGLDSLAMPLKVRE